jgi:hypothetical protein
MFLPVPEGIFIVEIAGNVESLPHVQQCSRVPMVLVQRSEFILNLKQDDVSTVYLQVGADHLGEGLEVDQYLGLVGCVVAADG